MMMTALSLGSCCELNTVDSCTPCIGHYILSSPEMDFARSGLRTARSLPVEFMLSGTIHLHHPGHCHVPDSAGNGSQFSVLSPLMDRPQSQTALNKPEADAFYNHRANNLTSGDGGGES